MLLWRIRFLWWNGIFRVLKPLHVATAWVDDRLIAALEHCVACVHRVNEDIEAALAAADSQGACNTKGRPEPEPPST